MLAYKNRFHGYGSLKYTYRNGQTVRSRLITVKSVENSRRKSPRFAVVVSKKVFKKANGRNRMRRRVYEILRHQSPALKSNQDTVLIITSPDVRIIEHEVLEQTIIESLSILDLYK